MAKTYRFKDRFEASRERIQEILVDPRCREDEATQVARAIEAKCDVTEPGPGLKRLTVRQKEYGRGLDGKKDTSKIEDVTLVVDWDCAAFEGRWKWSMASQADRVRVEGSTRIVADGNACSVLEEGRVDVKVPMIGSMIEGKVVSGLEHARPRWVDWLKGKI